MRHAKPRTVGAAASRPSPACGADTSEQGRMEKRLERLRWRLHNSRDEPSSEKRSRKRREQQKPAARRAQYHILSNKAATSDYGHWRERKDVGHALRACFMLVDVGCIQGLLPVLSELVSCWWTLFAFIFTASRA